MGSRWLNGRWGASGLCVDVRQDGGDHTGVGYHGEYA
jgi:hypothetical protein